MPIRPNLAAGALREHLSDLFASTQGGLAGALLVGRFQSLRVKVGTTMDAKCLADIYYMDLDGEFLDTDADFLTDTYYPTSSDSDPAIFMPGPEIVVGRLTVCRGRLRKGPPFARSGTRGSC
jgi:hypothetical protein